MSYQKENYGKIAMQSLGNAPKGLVKKIVRVAKDIGKVGGKIGKRFINKGLGQELTPMQQKQMESYKKSVMK